MSHFRIFLNLINVVDTDICAEKKKILSFYIIKYHNQYKLNNKIYM